MHGASEARTSSTLLGRLRQMPTNQDAWSEFVDRYGPRIYSWCRQWRLQEADAQDVTQMVLAKLAQKLRTFTYDPTRSFSAWLKTVARNAWQDWQGNQHRPGAGSGDSHVLEQLRSLAAREDLLKHLEHEFDHELLEEAMIRVQLRVEPHTWAAFRLMTVEGCCGTDAAARLRMKVATVFVAKSKVQKMLQEEVRRLKGSDMDE
jgi:RNA polymerase sigma factor (sigma-70 family)